MSNDTEAEIRADERQRMSDLLLLHTETIAAFAGDKEKVVGLIALMLRLGEVPENVTRYEVPA